MKLLEVKVVSSANILALDDDKRFGRTLMQIRKSNGPRL